MLKVYLSTLLCFTAVDSLWLGWIAPSFYRAHIGHLMAESPDFFAASLFYLSYIWGLVYFVICPIYPLSQKEQIRHAAVFGGITYATFDLTSAAVFKDFSYLVVGVDILWGVILCSTVTLLLQRLNVITKTQG